MSTHGDGESPDRLWAPPFADFFEAPLQEAALGLGVRELEGAFVVGAPMELSDPTRPSPPRDPSPRFQYDWRTQPGSDTVSPVSDD